MRFLPLLCGLLVLSSPQDKAEPVTVKGKAVFLADALKAKGIAADPKPIADQVVILGDGDAITPLLSDEASRALFLDKTLRDREVEVEGRKFKGNPYLQVVTIKVRHEGKMRTPEYYCDVCSISVRFPQICPCCGGEMELRMKPESR